MTQVYQRGSVRKVRVLAAKKLGVAIPGSWQDAAADVLGNRFSTEAKLWRHLGILRLLFQRGSRGTASGSSVRAWAHGELKDVKTQASKARMPVPRLLIEELLEYRKQVDSSWLFPNRRESCPFGTDQ